MSVDSKEVVLSKANKSGAALFISKPVSPNDLKDLWQFVAMKKKANSNKNSKRRPQRFECGDANTKKPKVVWTNALHYRFLEAIRSIGLERAVPKKILQVMDVPGLTRENVASHLQKYRMFLKRVSDASYKLEASCEDDEAMNRTTSYVSNYSLNRLTKPQFRFENFPVSYQTHPTSNISLGSNSINTNSEITSTTHLVHHQSGNSVNFDIDELLNNIDQTCYAEHLNEPLLLPPLPSSNLSLVQDQQFNGGIVDDSRFCSVYDLPASHVQQPFHLNPTHLHSSIPSYQLINLQNQQQVLFLFALHFYISTQTTQLLETVD